MCEYFIFFKADFCRESLSSAIMLCPSDFSATSDATVLYVCHLGGGGYSGPCHTSPAGLNAPPGSEPCSSCWGSCTDSRSTAPRLSPVLPYRGGCPQRRTQPAPSGEPSPIVAGKRRLRKEQVQWDPRTPATLSALHPEEVMPMGLFPRGAGTVLSKVGDTTPGDTLRMRQVVSALGETAVQFPFAQ